MGCDDPLGEYAALVAKEEAETRAKEAAFRAQHGGHLDTCSALFDGIRCTCGKDGPLPQPIRDKKRPILVGEDNPYGSDPRYALFPLPANSAGHRLCYYVMDLPRSVYVKRFDRVNLCRAKWSAKEARDTADALKQSGRVFVLLGAKVCKAFGIDFEPFTIQRRMTNPAVEIVLKVPHDEWTYVVLPHPSGRNRMWNEPYAQDRAHKILIEAGVLLAGDSL